MRMRGEAFFAVDLCSLPLPWVVLTRLHGVRTVVFTPCDAMRTNEIQPTPITNPRPLVYTLHRSLILLGSGCGLNGTSTSKMASTRGAGNMHSHLAKSSLGMGRDGTILLFGDGRGLVCAAKRIMTTFPLTLTCSPTTTSTCALHRTERDARNKVWQAAALPARRA